MFLIFLFVIYMTGQLNVLLKKEVFILNDKKIISAIINRDEQMLAFVVQKYSKLLWKIAASVLVNAASVQDVEECVADAFIYLWEHPEKYDPDKAKLSSWLAVITRSRAIDRYRQIMKKGELSVEGILVEGLGHNQSFMSANAGFGTCAELGTYATGVSDETAERLLSCVEELETKEKELIVRRYYYEQKPAEIAVALDMPKKQVENRLYQAKQKLKRMMEKKGA